MSNAGTGRAGRWNLAFSLVVLAAPLLVLGIPGTLGRYTEHYRQKGQFRSYLRRTALMTACLAVAGLAVLAFGRRSVSWLLFGNEQEARMISLMTVTLLAVIAYNFLVELLTSLRQIRTVALMRFGHGLAFTVISVALLWRWPVAQSIVVSYLVACVIVALVVISPVWKSVQGLAADTGDSAARQMWKKLLPFAGWLWMADLLSNLFAAADRYMIVHFAGVAAHDSAAIVGQYSSSRVFPELIVAVAVLLSAMILPYLSHDWEMGNVGRVVARTRLTIKLYCVAMTVGGICLVAIAPWMFGTVLKGKYTQGLSVLPWTLTYCTWYGMYVLLQNFVYCAERAWMSSVALLFGLMLNVTLNYLWLPILGLHGAVLATSCANAFALGAIYLLANRAGLTRDGSTLDPFSCCHCVSWSRQLLQWSCWEGGSSSGPEPHQVFPARNDV